MQAEDFRVELTGYAYRMLGSGSEAEDAVQETLLRAWKNAGRYDEERGSLRTWLYRIATNVCLDMLRSAQRRARPVDLGPAVEAGAPLGVPLPESTWVRPIADARVLPGADDPAEQAVRRESVRLAFVAALQKLSPRQRAVLILRDVLGWQAAEVAALLETSEASVTSALQRARASVRRDAPVAPLEPDAEALLDRYCRAFARYDVTAMIALLHEDATMSMPPFTWWLRGREAIADVLRHGGGSCEGARMVPVAMNGTTAFWQERPTGPGGAFEPFALMLFETAGGLITEIVTFLDERPMSSGPLPRIPSENEEDSS
ncbi:sigma-70 family RNA polymerase sigma factor [Actinoplanes friuliensis]|uniref:RNA polymerase factor sigma-70 n=1 Tax=Actinoplanes friuliensis DSM 7358 TaxID=1246995 RepID=U5W2R2_9ACTN|nr:sigma-70 family RNA polymerase sigma factor [Actinoplanes friuliensis]AGZ43518.1 RNA polymerase factor sigma-70 [Actinoplanes friuliensis DSM 7358]